MSDPPQSRLLTPVILCGGAGTRLWPVSREEVPKQFIALLGSRTSFQDTVLRVADASLFEAPLVVTNERYADLVANQLDEIGVRATVLIEPARRDSGPAIAAASAFLARQDADPGMIVLPSDHVVRDEAAFRGAVETARRGLEAGYIVTFGIEPDHPATGYGYIQQGDRAIGPGLRSVERFVEKPDLTTARRYLSEGYLWNAGYFVFRASLLLSEYERSDPGTVEAVRAAVAKSCHSPRGLLLDPEAFERCRPLSLDYAVIEGSSRVSVVPVSMGWSDVGSWHAVWELSEKDGSGNVAQGPAVFTASRGNFVRSADRLVCLVGVEGLGVVVTPDAILVCDRRADAALKELIDVLRTDDARRREGLV